VGADRIRPLNLMSPISNDPRRLQNAWKPRS
jgi:hypothetical protein